MAAIKSNRNQFNKVFTLSILVITVRHKQDHFGRPIYKIKKDHDLKLKDY